MIAHEVGQRARIILPSKTPFPCDWPVWAFEPLVAHVPPQRQRFGMHAFNNLERDRMQNPIPVALEGSMPGHS
jgi:hypothetical protein